MNRGIAPWPSLLIVPIVALGAQVACSRAAEAPAAAPARANVQQVMRGILFPSSNVVFAAQSDDPEQIPRDDDPATATDPLKSAYGGWEAVMNAGMSLEESARLLEVSRKCANGRDAPISDQRWKNGLAELRAAGLAAFEAGRAKNQDRVLEAAEKVSTSCSTCHDVFREKEPRCTP